MAAIFVVHSPMAIFFKQSTPQDMQEWQMSLGNLKRERIAISMIADMIPERKRTEDQLHKSQNTSISSPYICLVLGYKAPAGIEKKYWFMIGRYRTCVARSSFDDKVLSASCLASSSASSCIKQHVHSVISRHKQAAVLDQPKDCSKCHCTCSLVIWVATSAQILYDDRCAWLWQLNSVQMYNICQYTNWTTVLVDIL